MNIHWDSKTYTDHFSFVAQYGSGVLDLLDLPEGSRVLDLGCGNGALTRELAKRGYAARGMDASAEMLEIARRDAPEIPFDQGDATAFALPEPVDGVFSNAVFHWIDAVRQPEMLACVHGALRSGGQFVFEMGGSGNNTLIHAALAEVFAKRGLTYRMPFYFPSIGEYATLLEKAGFRVEYAILFDRMTPLEGENGLADWMKMFLGVPFAGLEEETGEELRREAAELLRDDLCRDGRWYADYVRLRMKAVRL